MMEQLLGAIPVTFSDAQINSLLRDTTGSPTHYKRHYTQSEEFMLRLPKTYTVDSCPIHHDVRKTSPGTEHLSLIRGVVEQLAEQLPSVFEGLTHIFDPAEILRPAFFKVYELESQSYLYLLRLDLHYRPFLHEVITRGDNDRTATYRTNAIVLEADFIPLNGVETARGKLRSFQVEQAVSQTWIGESGRGYLVQGIWLDRDLTRFFSKLFMPRGIRAYPYYPFTCKYRAVCHTVTTLDDAARRKSLPLLHRARTFLLPHLREIEGALRAEEFNEKLPSFIRLRDTVPSGWADVWKEFAIRVYLNKDDQREYELEHSIV
ncbi:MAG: hypothetical protein V3S41_03775 [Spirochaetia bacterium]